MSEVLTVLQRRVQAWCDAEWGGAYWPPLGNLARLMEELGELARLLNDQAGYKPKKAEEEHQDLALELGDMLFTLLALANSTGVNLDEAFDAVMQKYAQRDRGRYRSGVASSNRDMTRSE
ncbi:MAG: nucleotide pyrophosphohydrolase [Chloroflexi bacterium]|nr:nucleotide pyrophosphohydrolase [Chloroflexota bacterium]